ncbi:T9SS type A sorting domain-containing protein [bacterium SCSIO 12741]|nr:T9SS type A sorting domain-containing protein [bacterium SCSIO 12741]
MIQRLALLLSLALILSIQLQAQPTPLDTRIQISKFTEVEGRVVRLLHDSVGQRLIYARVNGDIYQVDSSSGALKDSLLYTSADHGITYLQGMDIRDSLWVICGNINAFKEWTTGRVSKAKLQSNGSRTWAVLAETEPYESADYFDHLFSGLIITPTDSIIWCSGARGDHGEIQDYYGKHPGIRNVPLTSVLLCASTHDTNKLLKNDSLWLIQNQVIYARGTRNFFDFDYDQYGHLYALENSGDRDDPDEMNRVVRGAHYGFPWNMGGNLTPQQFLPFDPTQDKLIHPNCWAMSQGFFHADSTYPPPPPGVTFKEAVRNFGPDADYYRDPITGGVKQASQTGDYITTFSAHRSPLGLVFSRGRIEGVHFSDKGFLLSWTPGGDSTGTLAQGGVGTFVDESEDLLMISPRSGSFDEIESRRVIRGLNRPIDMTIVNGELYIVEYADSASPIYRVTFQDTGSQVIDTTVSVQLSSEDFFIRSFPNPARDHLIITGSGMQEPIEIEFVNLQGDQVKREVLDEFPTELDISDLSPGFYVLGIHYGERKFLEKLMVR